MKFQYENAHQQTDIESCFKPYNYTCEWFMGDGGGGHSLVVWASVHNTEDHRLFDHLLMTLPTGKSNTFIAVSLEPVLECLYARMS
jgi:hypothetical protein